MAKTAVKDMTQGRPLPLILGFYIPCSSGFYFSSSTTWRIRLLWEGCLGGKRSGGGRLYQFPSVL